MRNARQIQRDWALFLDLDGTLLDIADRPELVSVPRDLPANLRRLSDSLAGAVAVVTGRSLGVLDGLIGGPGIPAGAEHGAIVRYPDGHHQDLPATHVPEAWIAELDHAASRWPGVVIERKPRSVVAHFRLAPERAAAVEALMRSLPGLAQRGYVLLAARMAFEAKPANASKARAVELLMQVPPFAGRIPVFIGDDVTDEAGIEMAQKLGGFGLRVPEAFGGSPAQVRAWIARGVSVEA